MNPKTCDTCPISPCAFDRQALTDAQQDALCPAVGSAEATATNGQYPKQNTLEFAAWRSEKLKEIQAIIDNKGPVKLIDLPALVNVPHHTLEAWRVKWFRAELIRAPHKGIHKHKFLVFVNGANEDNAIPRTRIGDEYLETIKKLIDERGPMLVPELAKAVGMHKKTLYVWARDQVSVEYRGSRLFVIGIIDKGDDHAKEKE